MTTTMQHFGHVAGRARRVAPVCWRAAAAGFRGTTGVDVTPLPVSAYETPGNTTDANEPAAAMVVVSTTIKPCTRHLGSRST